VDRFVRETLSGSRAGWFLSRFAAFHRRVAKLGMVNSLAQTVLKIVSPGVADFYQGTETWNLSLVVPDNRRPVPFSALAGSLSELKAAHASDPVRLAARLLAQWENGLVKLYLTGLGLQFRRRHADVLLRGEYLPLAAAGALRAHVCAFARRWKDRWVLAAVPRLMARRIHDGLPTGERLWSGTTLPLPGEAPAQWRHVLTGELVRVHRSANASLRMADLLRHWPVALLEQA
jgi:(1->4)-alpha-D-glucan 1-alpha-D-glucosylmutase